MYAEKNLIHIKKSRAILLCIIFWRMYRKILYTLKSRIEIFFLMMSRQIHPSHAFLACLSHHPWAQNQPVSNGKCRQCVLHTESTLATIPRLRLHSHSIGDWSWRLGKAARDRHRVDQSNEPMLIRSRLIQQHCCQTHVRMWLSVHFQIRPLPDPAQASSKNDADFRWEGMSRSKSAARLICTQRPTLWKKSHGQAYCRARVVGARTEIVQNLLLGRGGKSLTSHVNKSAVTTWWSRRVQRPSLGASPT